MKRKIAAFILSAMIALSALGGCAQAETLEPITFTEEELSRETKMVPNPDLTGELTFRYFGSVLKDEPNFRDNAIYSMYREYFPNVELNVEAISCQELSIEAYQTQLAAEVMAGSGPDVIFIELEEDAYINPYKMMQAGAFLDLTEYFRNDASYNPSDFYQPVMDAGRYRGRQYLVPVWIRFPLFITTESIAAKTGFHPENCVDLKSTWEELLPVLRENPMNLPEKDVMYSLYTPYFAPGFTGLPWIDYETQEVALEDPRLEEYCRFIKDELQAYSTGIRNAYVGFHFYSFIENESYAFVDLWRSPLHELTQENLRYLALDGVEDVQMIPWRTMNGEIEALATEMLGVTRNCQNPDAAYQMVKLWVSEEFFANPGVWGHDNAPIVNRKAMQAYMEAMKEPLIVYRDEYGAQDAPGLSQDIIDQYLKLMDEITICRLSSPEWYMAQDTLQEYYSGERSYESCISELQSKLEIYVTE